MLEFHLLFIINSYDFYVGLNSAFICMNKYPQINYKTNSKYFTNDQCFFPCFNVPYPS